MTPAARLAAAVEVLAALEQTAEPADKVLREFFRARRYAGSKDRAAVAERVYDCLRHYYSYGWRMQSAAPRALAIASVLAEGAAPEDFFNGLAYGPAALSEEEIAAIAATPAAAPLHVQGEFPEWLQPELSKAFGADLLVEMQAMRGRASIDIRVNTLKTTRHALASALASEGFEAEPTTHAATGLRLSGATTSKLSASPLFLAGHFEFQDEAAQVAALLCATKPGLRVLDYAAGGGGKSLALAASMQNTGTLVAHDISAGRLAMLPPRAERAGVKIITTSSQPQSDLFDIVLLDSPCSGTGTWRRQPELRVRLTAERLADVVALQAELLASCAALVAPGGRLVYATCSVLRCENDEQIAAFLAAHSEFAVEPVSATDKYFHASPYATQTDGFFAAVLQRSP
jgi:16S rRNA (cytosine967-C5)-methyltransferase